MRTRVCIFMLAAGCSAASKPSPVATAADSGVAAPAVDASVVAIVDASVPSEPALAWGTRAPAAGPLYPVIEGECLNTEVWPLDSADALFTYGEFGGSATTVAHFTADGLEDAADTKQAAGFHDFSPISVHGSWPEPLVALSIDRPGTRARNYETYWAHRAEGGWVSILSHRDAGAPASSGGDIFRGNAILQRHTNLMGGFATYREGSFEAIPIAKDAPKLANVGGLGRADMIDAGVSAGTDEIYVMGRVELSPGGAYADVLRVWRDGKVRDVKLPPGANRHIFATKPSLVIAMSDHDLRRLGDGDKWEPVQLDGAATDKIVSMTTAPDGSIWTSVDPGHRIFRRDPSGKVEEMKPPSEAETAPSMRKQFPAWPMSGARLVGIEKGDPWALSDTGTLAHHVDGAWTVVPVPAPYRAEAISLVAKGDLYITASYVAKGPGWKTPANHRAVLRTRRPRETLRCNEGAGGFGYTNGRGFTSFPPRATAECKTPFAILLRTAYATSNRAPKVNFDAKADFAPVRDAIKGTAGLGETVDLLEIASGEQRYLGLAVPRVEVGNAIADSVAKKVKTTPEVHPEVVCGQPPKIVRTIKVDVATGKVVP